MKISNQINLLLCEKIKLPKDVMKLISDVKSKVKDKGVRDELSRLEISKNLDGQDLAGIINFVAGAKDKNLKPLLDMLRKLT